MKSKLLLLSVLAFATALLAFRIRELSTARPAGNTTIKRNIIRCSPDWNALKDWLEESDIPPIPGAGNYRWTVTTTSDSARFYFNQGINMYYSFHIIESMASFKKAAKFDPGSAMLYWAQALAYGPNINDVGYAASPEALAAIEKAVELAGKASRKEQLLIHAQQVRYSEDSTQSREKLNQLYADRMKEVYEAFPNDPDIAALYADALMLQHPWDLWYTDGTPKPWTPAIRKVLERLLAQTPNHPGANHYYIHVMEPSPYAALALPSADRMGKLTPGLSHTVHMPSHIYLRTGNYAKGIAVNESAISSYKKTIPLYEPVTGNAFLYILHNLHMQTNHAMMAGIASASSKAARELTENIPAEYLSTPGGMGNYIQYVYMTPILVDIRFGNWNKILNYPQPDAAQVYRNLLYHFGRGMALSHLSKPGESKQELEIIQQLLKDSSLSAPFSPFSPSSMGASVAFNLLAGTIALQEKKYDESVRLFQQAVTTEENMVYDEPRDWLLNPKHFLGNALVKAGHYEEAINVLEKDLLNNKENGWALFGIWQACTAKKKTAEAAKWLARFKKAFGKADIKLEGPVF